MVGAKELQTNGTVRLDRGRESKMWDRCREIQGSGRERDEQKIHSEVIPVFFHPQRGRSTRQQVLFQDVAMMMTRSS